MKARALTIAELERINYATGIGARNLLDQLSKLAIIASDAHVEKRREAQNCAPCFYLSRYRLAGQAFTHWNCQLCEAPQPMHHNTAVPRICAGCATTYGLCVCCGGDIETENRGRRTGRKARKQKCSPEARQAPSGETEP